MTGAFWWFWDPRIRKPFSVMIFGICLSSHNTIPTDPKKTQALERILSTKRKPTSKKNLWISKTKNWKWWLNAQTRPATNTANKSMGSLIVVSQAQYLGTGATCNSSHVRTVNTMTPTSLLSGSRVLGCILWMPDISALVHINDLKSQRLRYPAGNCGRSCHEESMCSSTPCHKP